MGVAFISSNGTAHKINAESTPVVTTQPASLLFNFDENFNDSSVNNLSVVVFGDPPVQITTLEKKYGIGSADFLGAAYLSHLVVEDSPSLDLSGGEFTIETWFYARTLPDGIPPDAFSALISKDTYGSNFSWCIAVATGGVGVFTNNIAGDWNFTSLATITTNEWHHVAVCGTANSMNCFLDGVLIGSSSFGLSNASSSLTVGCLSWNNINAFFDGYIDDLRVVKGLAVYTGPFSPPSAPLSTNVTLYPANASLVLNFDGNFIDESVNGLIPVENGGVATTTDQTKFGSGSLYLDGVDDYLGFSSLSLGIDPFTVECWVRISELKDCAIFNQGNSDTTGNFCLAVNSSDGSLYLYADNLPRGGTTTGSLSINQWHHVALTRNNLQNYTIYIDGIPQWTYTGSHNHYGIPFKIGHGYGGITHFPGFIDGFRVCKFLVYDGPFTPPTTPPSPTLNNNQISGPNYNFKLKYQPYEATASLLLNFDGNLNDESVNGIVFTNNGTSFDTVEKKYGLASLSLNNGYLSSADYTDVADLVDSDFTIEAWVWRPSGTSYATILNLSKTPGFPYGIHFLVDGDNQLRWDEGSIPCAVGGAVPVEQWSHVAAVRKNGIVTIYIDGINVGTSSVPPQAGPYKAWIGCYDAGYPNFLSQMKIDGLRICRFVVYDGSFVPPTTPPSPIL